MGELTGKQKRHLRSLGQKLSAIAAVGKAGLTEAVLANLSALLDQHELVKVRLGGLPPADRAALAAQIEQATGAQCVGIVGRTALLYRANPELDAKHRINLNSQA